MKTNRNDPCPCGSGKKFKKCCLGKSRPVVPEPRKANPFPVPRPAPRQTPALSTSSQTEKRVPEQPPQPPDPFQQKWDATWKKFGSLEGATKEAFFLQTLEDPELRDDESAFEMLSNLRQDALERGEQERFGRLFETFVQRYPELYRQSAHFYLSWQLLDALAEGRADILPLTQAMAAQAGRHLDIVMRGLDALAYHGQLAALVETMRIGWPLVRDSKDLMPWGIHEFSENGASYEMYAYLEETTSPDSANPEMLGRIRYFIENPRLDYLAEFLGDVSGQTEKTWSVADFTMKPPKKRRGRDDWDDDEDEEDQPAVDPGAQNLNHLIMQFVGYLRRVEGVPYPRGELIRHELLRYFLDRHRGDLNPQLSMLDQAFNPKKKLPPPPKPSHPICPERVTLDKCLGQSFGILALRYHKAAALFGSIPAWLRFLQSKKLIDDEQHARTLKELGPLHADILKLMENYKEDPTLYRSLKGWPDVT